MTPPVGDGAFARWLAAYAGQRLLALRDDLGYEDPGALRAAGDKDAHDLLVTELQRWRPGDAVLSEEGVRDDPLRQSAERVWIIDPLDGTREFGERGRTDWAVHVALWSRKAAARRPESGRGAGPELTGLEAGAVALPAQHRVLATDHPSLYPPLAGLTSLRLVVSRSRPAPFLASVAEQLGAELVPMGSAGAKIAAVVTGDADAYLHAGGQYEWDSAAPVAVARATGLHASRIDGSALVYNQVDPSLPDLLVCRRDLAERLLAAVARTLKEQ